MFEFATLTIRMDNLGFLKSLDTTSAKLATLGKHSRTVGIGLSALSVPLGLFAKSAVSNLTTFNDEMTKSTAIMGNVSEELRARLDNAAKDISTKLPLGVNEAARSFFFLASAGLTAEQSLQALPVVAKFATAGAFDMATATDLLTDAQSALGLSSKDTIKNMQNMTYLSDLFVKGNTLANTSVQQLSEAITSDAGATIKSFNLNMENSVAVLAAYADRGIKASNAGNMFGRMIRLLGSKAISNSEDFKKAGVSVFDAGGNFRDMSLIVKDLEVRFSHLTTEQRVAQLEQLGFNALASKAILPLIGMSDKIAEYTVGLKGAGGMTEEVTQKQLKSLGVQFALIKNKVRVLTIELASRFEPELRSMQETLNKVVDAFRSIPPRMQKIIGSFVLLGAVAGPALIAFSFIVGPLIKIIGLLKVFGVSLVAMKSIGFAGVMSKIATAIWGVLKFFVVLAAKALVLYLAFNLLKGMFKRISERTSEMRVLLSDMAASVFPKLSSKVKELGLTWSDLGDYLQAMAIYMELFGALGVDSIIYIAEVTWEFFKGLCSNFAVAYEYLTDNWALLWENSWELLVAFGKDFGGFWINLFGEVQSLFNGDGWNWANVSDNLHKNMKKAVKDAGLPNVEMPDAFAGARDVSLKFALESDKLIAKTELAIKKLADESVARKNKISEAGSAGAVPSVIENSVNVDMPDITIENTLDQVELENALVRGTTEAYKAEKQAALENRNIKANEQTAKNTKDILSGISKLGGDTNELVVI